LIVVVLLALLGGILFQLIGFCIAAFAKTVDAAQGMAQAVAIPMMFLAGIFFPIDSLPVWLSNIVKFLPLAPLLRMLRTVAIESGSPFQSPSNILIVFGWILITLTISIYKFRLTEE
jgi:ABC-2 type transport system permease protein